MELKPIKNYKRPLYPTKSIVLKNPELLKNLPSRWKNNIYVCIALSSLMAVSISGCQKYEGTKGASVNGSTYDQNPDIVSPDSSAIASVTPNLGLNSGCPAKNTTKVNINSSNTISISTNSIVNIPTPNNNANEANKLIPPIFVHGDGRGSFGCVSVSPPVFLSEEEAYQVICEEAKSYGIEFIKDSIVIKDTYIPKTYIYVDVKGNGIGKDKGNLTVDGFDKNKKIGFEFVSKDDFIKWSVEQKCISTAENYNLIDAAKVLREGLAKKPDEASIGVFYDPVSKLLYDKEGKIQTLQGIEELKLQVRDFLSWLKAQQII
ncbi:MAG: hypothetical protein Q8942_19420 [Bacillota bacterium]|nr:hypothetical protein [Bacillota bacterium]